MLKVLKYLRFRSLPLSSYWSLVTKLFDVVKNQGRGFFLAHGQITGHDAEVFARNASEFFDKAGVQSCAAHFPYAEF